MIKRKNGVKAITTMVIVMIMFIISAVPVFAASYLNEVNVLDDFVVQVENPTKEAYRVTLYIEYQDENGNTLYKEKVCKDVEAFETITLDAKDYYNSEKTQKVVAEINQEKNIKTTNMALYWAIGAAILFVLFIIFMIVYNHVDSDVLDAIAYICLAGSLILGFIALAIYVTA